MGRYSKYKKNPVIRACLNTYKFFAVPLYSILCSVSKFFVGHHHRMLMFSEWCINYPENFNHDIDQYYIWSKTGKSHWVERGVYSNLALQCFEEPILIELCCGDGYNTKHFYSKNSKRIFACDFDKKAIKRARKVYKMPNIEFAVADIRTDIPDRVCGELPTNIIWDTAIEYFTLEDIDKIMERIHTLLTPKKGILSGHSVAKSENGVSAAKQHEYEFKDMADLKRFLTAWFENVKVFETIYEDRHNLYFWASDGELPFDDNWKHMY